MNLIVGDLVVINKPFCNSASGTLGVVYERYNGDGSCSIINNHGECCGFSPIDLERWQIAKLGHRKDFSHFEFKNVMDLQKRYSQGFFDDAFNAAYALYNREVI